MHRSSSVRLTSIIILSAGIAALSGCVAKSQYVKEQQRASDLDAKVASLGAQVTTLNEKLKSSEESNAALAQQVQTSQQSAAQLASQKAEQDQAIANLQGEIQSNQVKISQIAGKISINMVDKILFDSGSSRLKSDGQKVLLKVGAAISKIQDKRIWVGGHTDDVAISPSLRDTFATNWELSSARATAVVRFLQDKAGIPGERLLAVGQGQYQPVGDNKTPEGRQANRRIEILLIPTQETLKSIQ